MNKFQKKFKIKNSDTNKIISIILIVFFLSFIHAYSQNNIENKFDLINSNSEIGNTSILSDSTTDRNFSFIFSILPSYSILLTKSIDFTNGNFSGLLRLTWETNRKLGLGLEIGKVPISKIYNENVQTNDGATNFSGKMSAIPLVLIFKEKIYSFYLFAGFGLSQINSEITAFNETTSSKIYAGTYSYGIGYEYEIYNKFLLGLESKGFFYNQIDKFTLQLGASISYKISY